MADEYIDERAQSPLGGENAWQKLRVAQTQFVQHLRDRSRTRTQRLLAASERTQRRRDPHLDFVHAPEL
jgi:hypothetical protein